MSDEFKVASKTITIATRRLTVHKKTFELQLRRFSLMEQAEKSLNSNAVPQEDEGIEALIRRGFTLRTYPSLLACTTGKVFTEEECFKIDNDELEAWLTAARDLNPDWFPNGQPDTKEEQAEKKA